jgi:hypothetical protein
MAYSAYFNTTLRKWDGRHIQNGRTNVVHILSAMFITGAIVSFDGQLKQKNI